jgi:hypothetical protein
MSRKRKQKRGNTLRVSPSGYRVYKPDDGKGPPYRAALEASIRQSGLRGVVFEAVILHADYCLSLRGFPTCSCPCVLGELRTIGESPDPEVNMVQMVHVAAGRN